MPDVYTRPYVDSNVYIATINEDRGPTRFFRVVVEFNIRRW